MITIDLLPPQAAGAAAVARHRRALGTIAAVAAAIALLIAHGALEIARAVTERRRTAVGVALADLERPVAALRRLRQRQAALRRRLDVIAGLEARRSSLVRILDALAAAAPTRLWLTELTVDDGRLRIAGLASDEQLIAEFLARLRATDVLAALDLEEASRDDRAPAAPRRFVVAGHLGGGA
jgi:type IV pilus assembly protein PilN